MFITLCSYKFGKTLPDEALMDVLIEFVFTDFPKYDICPLFNNN